MGVTDGETLPCTPGVVYPPLSRRSFLLPALAGFAALRGVRASLLPHRTLSELRQDLTAQRMEAAQEDEVELPICIEGQAVPRLFLLGHQKCGTTTMASDLRMAGASFFVEGLKESHQFDALCGFYRGHKSEYAYEIDGCPAATPDVKARWLDSLFYRSCDATQGTLLEATPGNIIIPGLPSLLPSLYGPDARRLGFVLLLREQLSRMQSEWWYEAKGAEVMEPAVPHVVTISIYSRYKSFAGYLSSIEPKVQMYKAQGYRGMEKDTDVDVVYRSLYSLSLEPWLGNFSRDQFVIVPLSYYVGTIFNRDAVIRRLEEKFGATVSPAALHPQELHYNQMEPPPLWQEVDNATVAHWYNDFFRPDLKRLASMLAEGMAVGLEVSGYEGGPGGDAAAMFAYLRGALPCLM